MFWEGEVFKTSESTITYLAYILTEIFNEGHFADHPLEDVIEKIACQFTARHIRGRPRPPFWYLGFPLYVCDSRYNDRDRVFVKIKNWNSCVPEEVRKSTEFMPIYPFEQTVLPARLPSPFIGRSGLKGSVSGKGPGGLVAGEVADQVAVDTQGAGDANGQKRTRTAKSHAGGLGAPGTEMASALTQFTYQSPNTLHQVQGTRSGGPDRSVITAAGGLSALGQDARIEKLPTETGTWLLEFITLGNQAIFFIAKHFDRDPETNQVLWFPAPPVNMARPTNPKYSMTYLHFLANKRKREDEDAVTEVDGGSRNHDCVHVPSTIAASPLGST